MTEHGSDPLSHVIDHNTLDLPWPSRPTFEWVVPLPEIFGVQITRFMVMEVLASLLLIAIMVSVVRHMIRNHISRGGLMNAFEAMLLYIRDDVARPAIGGHAADRFLPYLWTVFFFVLFNNLMGMVPGMASATGNINVTAVLAISTLVTVIYAGSKEMGMAGFWLGLVPHLDVPFALKIFLWPLMFVIELAGLLIKHFVLSVRLFANMLGGHIVLAVILGFTLTAHGWLSYVVIPSSLIGVILLSLLEIFVAFLQAYIFTFLSALFIGSAVHPH